MPNLANQGHFKEVVSLNLNEETEIALDPAMVFNMGAIKLDYSNGSYNYDNDLTSDYGITMKYIMEDGSTVDAFVGGAGSDSAEEVPYGSVADTANKVTSIKFVTNNILDTATINEQLTKPSIDIDFYYFNNSPASYIKLSCSGIGDGEEIFIDNKAVLVDDALEDGFYLYYPANTVKESIDQKLRDLGQLGAGEQKTAYDLGTIPDGDFYINWIGTYNFLPHKLDETYTGGFGEIIVDWGEIKNYLTPISQQISTPEELFNLRFASNSVIEEGIKYELINNIDLNDFTLPSFIEADMFKATDRVEDNLQPGHFPPIYNFYMGGFDNSIGIYFEGNGYTIKNLTYKTESFDEIGFFSKGGFLYKYNPAVDDYVPSEFEIKNFKLENVDVQGNWYTGGLVGYLYGSGDNNWHIDNIQVDGIVKAADECGGLIGYGEDYYDGNGADTNIKVRKSSFTGTLESGYYTGGLAGYSEGYFENCYARGDFTDNSKVAGLIGEYYSARVEDEIKNCYFAGTLTGTGNISPLINDGSNDVLINCYYDSDLMGDVVFTNEYINEQSKTTEEMTYPLDDTNVYVEWDFENIWNIYEDKNEGYPTFEEVVPITITRPVDDKIAIGGMDVGVYTIYRRWRRS